VVIYDLLGQFLCFGWQKIKAVYSGLTGGVAISDGHLQQLYWDGIYGFWACAGALGRLLEFINQAQRGTRRVEHRTFKDVFQLPDISWPVLIL